MTLSFGVSGTVSKVNVQVGDQVKKGDVLAELDTTDLELAIAQAEQEYLSQQATYSDDGQSRSGRGGRGGTGGE